MVRPNTETKCDATETAFSMLFDQLEHYTNEMGKENQTPFFIKTLTKFGLNLSNCFKRWNDLALKLKKEREGTPLGDGRRPPRIYQQPHGGDNHVLHKTQEHERRRSGNHQNLPLQRSTSTQGPEQGEAVAEAAKNAAIFKPQTLLYDASVNGFRQWQNRFKAYYDQSNVSDQGPALHHTFILTCIDDNLADVIETETTGKDTLVYKSNCVMSYTQILEEYLDNLHPIHVSSSDWQTKQTCQPSKTTSSYLH